MDKMELYMAFIIASIIICAVLVWTCLHCFRRLRRKLAANAEMDMDLELAEAEAEAENDAPAL